MSNVEFKIRLIGSRGTVRGAVWRDLMLKCDQHFGFRFEDADEDVLKIFTDLWEKKKVFFHFSLNFFKELLRSWIYPISLLEIRFIVGFYLRMSQKIAYFAAESC